MMSHNRKQCQRMLGRQVIPANVDELVSNVETMKMRCEPAGSAQLSDDVLYALLGPMKLPEEIKTGSIGIATLREGDKTTEVQGIYEGLSARGHYIFRLKTGMQIVAKPIDVRWPDPATEPVTIVPEKKPVAAVR